MTIMVAAGAGFIGGKYVLDWVASTNEPVINLEKLTYVQDLDDTANGSIRIAQVVMCKATK